MHRLVIGSLVVGAFACSKQESGAPTSSGSAAGSATTASAAPTPDAPSDAASDPIAEVAQLVVHDVGSKALGGQTIDASCVSVTVVPAGEWTVAAARLNDCGSKVARSILWLYKRKTGPWTEDYAGQPPRCWKGVPPDIAQAVTIATKIPRC